MANLVINSREDIEETLVAVVDLVALEHSIPYCVEGKEHAYLDESRITLMVVSWTSE